MILPAMATADTAIPQHITLSDPMHSQDHVLLYEVYYDYANATSTSMLVGEYNDTDTMPIYAGHDYLMVFKPSTPGLLQNPLLFFQYFNGALGVGMSLFALAALGIMFMYIALKALKAI